MAKVPDEDVIAETKFTSTDKELKRRRCKITIYKPCLKPEGYRDLKALA
jgi:hypothetical protein